MSNGDDIISVPDLSDASEFLVPADSRPLTGVRLNTSEMLTLVRLFNNTYKKKNASVKLSKSEVKRLMGLKFVEEYQGPTTGFTIQYKITERGALRLLDPEALMVYDQMEL